MGSERDSDDLDLPMYVYSQSRAEEILKALQGTLH